MPNIAWDLVWRDRGVEKGLKSVASAHDQAERKAKAYRVAAGAAFVAVAAAAVKFGASSARAYIEAETAQAKLSDAFSRFPKLADTNQSALQRLNAERQKSTRFDDDATAAAQAQLAQYKLTGQQLTELTPLIQDYAARTGKDLPTAARDAGKAVLGQGRAFKSIGLDLKDTGTATGNYTQLVKGLRTQVGGFAEKEGKTAAGQVEILKNQFGELQESAGKHLVPAISAGVDKLTDLVEVVGENADVIVPLAGGVVALTTAVWLGDKAVKAYAVTQGLLNTAMSSNSRIATGFASVVSKAGPWGLAIGAGVTLVGLFAGSQAAAKRETRGFTDQLTFQKGALDANSAQMLVKKLADEGALETAKRAGVAEGEYVRALMEGGKARDDLIRKLDDTGTAARASADAFEGDVVAQEDLANASFDAADKLKLMGGGLDASKRAAELAESAYKGSGAATDDQAESAETAASRLRELADAMFTANRAALALSGSQIGYEQAVDDATKAVKENGKTLNTNTQAGRDNKTALNNLATSSQSYISKLVETGASSRKVTAATKDAREEFIRVAQKMGASRDRAKELADKYGLIPKKVRTDVTQPGMRKAIDDTGDLRTAINQITGKRVSINFDTNAYKVGKTKFAVNLTAPRSYGATGGAIESFRLIRRATGGPIHGPGTEKSDSIMGIDKATGIPTVWASNKEYITNARQYARNRRQVETINAGGDWDLIPRRAGGGTVEVQTGRIPRSAGQLASVMGWFPGAFARSAGRHLGEGFEAGLDKKIKAARARADAASSGSGGTVAAGPGWGPIMAAMRRHGARSFTTYPGHHPSAAMARDVTPHNWGAANAAKALSSVWYVIYRMKIASKTKGNGWQTYRPTNFRGDWRHEAHIHVARRRDQGGMLRQGELAFNQNGGNERVLTHAQNRGFENLVRVADRNQSVGAQININVSFPNYVGDRSDLKKALVDMNRLGQLDSIKRAA